VNLRINKKCANPAKSNPTYRFKYRAVHALVRYSVCILYILLRRTQQSSTNFKATNRHQMAQ